MGLFDFLKSKKPTDAPATPAPADSSAAPAPAAPSAGPRYKGSNYTAPAPEAPVAPVIPPMPVPPMPQPPAFQPTNVLEELLMRAATEPQVRPGFYQALLQEEVIVITAPQEGVPAGEVTVEAGSEIQLQVLHDGKIPVFTSKDRIFDGENVPEPLTYLRLRGFDLFNMVQGADCALNPFSVVGKLLPAAEIADLMSGNLFQGAGAPDGTQMLIGPPAEEPTALIEALRAYCAEHSFIEIAHLAELRLENSQEPPRLLLAFQTEQNDPAFLQELGPVIQGTLSSTHQFVDMMLIDPNSDEPLNQYFQQVEPLYQRA
ncbi:enhanced serine sensitivity protein SseB C-terminal domain-containing protein [Hymenobacter sp. GOD-10R]|uniref:enhanced serine sensitivity protein SseB C-terminal domain-containing protein n=1 Tax=Hymenobacter sp. GOD-10R TaxID=3093922 RepID=UPI002D7A27D2|nr:enhanced serine sensitivity protein SseB C-terminal domain-containing protein [Hymenobacter sp. GOD-10R]WRQ30814.1 enhanced serine sensitivity protein SseB C-terminal domain-containing protein [Hymenobacter sp. GOD-10R]